MHFVKVWDTILRSSVWDEPSDTRVVWLTFLCLADQDGFVEGVASSIARAANVSADASRTAIAVLEAPDLDSKSQEWGGRRIEKVEGGWIVLNANKYRDLQTPEQMRDAARKRRERAKAGGSPGHVPDTTSTSTSPSSSGSEVVVRSSARAREALPELARPAFDALAGDRADAVASCLESMHAPITGGRAYSWAEIGQALVAYHANEQGKFSARLFKGYLESDARGKPPRNGSSGRQARNLEAIQQFLNNGEGTNG